MKIRPAIEKLMTRDDLAAFLQVTTRTVDNLRTRGMPTIMVGASPRFEANAVKRWLEQLGTVSESEELGEQVRAYPDPNRVPLKP